jgi:hypothetical protein
MAHASDAVEQLNLPPELHDVIVLSIARVLAADYRKRHAEAAPMAGVPSGNEPSATDQRRGMPDVDR